MAKILLVDDDSSFRLMMRRLLADAGHATVEVEDGAAVLAAVAAHGPDLVICDMLMPGREGVETILDLRRRAPTLPVLAVSGGGLRSGGDYLELAVKCGAKGKLQKPFTQAELYREIDRVLSLPG